MTDPSCPVCGDDFSTETSLQNHCWDAHGACHHCGGEFGDRDSLSVHWLSSHDEILSSKDRVRAESAVGELTFFDRLSHQGHAGAVSGVSISRRGLLLGSVVGLGAGVGGTILTGSSGGGKTLDEHSATTGLETQPTLGPPPGEAEGTIVAFEDPSCPSCARFERGTFPQLKSELIDDGRLSFVFRGIPVVYPWAEPAALALEATYDRGVDVFWSLKEFYYRQQSSIGTENVQEVTRQFLADQTDVDAAAVVNDVDSGTFSDAVDTDLQASQDAGVRGTPTFFLFKEGSFVTEIIGPQSFDVFANPLGM